MSDTTAAATLSIAISTGDAAADLKKLSDAYTALKANFEKGAASSGFSKEATAEINKLTAAMGTMQARESRLLEEMDSLKAKFKDFSATAKESAVTIGTSLSGAATKQRIALKEMGDGFEKETTRMQNAIKAMAGAGIDYKPMTKGLDLVRLEADGTVKSLTTLVRTLEKAKAVSTAFSLRGIDASPVIAKDFGDGVNEMITRLPLLTAKLDDAKTAAALAAKSKSDMASAAKRVSSEATGAAAAQQKWNAAAGEGHALARGLSGSLGTLWMTYGAIAPLMAGAAMGAAFKEAATSGAELAYQLKFVQALSDESAGSIAALSQRTLELAQNSLYGPTEIASGFRILAQAGQNATDALKTMPHVLDLATVGEMEMEQAATTLVGVMNAFGLSVDRTSHVGDVFAKAAALSQTSVAAMTNAMKTASVVGEQYGASMEDTATAITLLAKVNITGTAAGTSLRNMLKELYTPTAGAAAVMKNLGIVTSDATGQVRPFADIIYDLQGKLKDFNKADQTTILQKIFGERGAKEAISMLALTRAEWDDLNKSISDSSGFMRKVGEQLEDTVKGRWIQAINTLKTNLVGAFDEMGPTFALIADNLKATFADPAFIDSLKTLVSGMASFVSMLVSAGPALVKFTEAWVALKVGMIAGSVWTAAAAGIGGLTKALGAAKVAMSAYEVGIGVAVGASGAAAAKTSLLSTAVGTLPARFAMLANPITAAVVVLGTLGTAFYLFRDRTAESMEASAKHVKNFAAESITALKEVLAKIDETNLATASATVESSKSVVSSNLKRMTDDLAVLKKQYGFADASSITSYVKQIDATVASGGTAKDRAVVEQNSPKYRAAKAYYNVLKGTLAVQQQINTAEAAVESRTNKKWAAKLESAYIDAQKANRSLSEVVTPKDPKTPSDAIAQINADYAGRIKAIQDGVKAEEAALQKAYAQSEISEVELIEQTAQAKAKAHLEALETYSDQIAKAEKAGAKGSQLTDLRNKQAEELRAVTQVWADAATDTEEAKAKFAKTLLSWEAKAFAKDGSTAVEEAQAKITQMMAELSQSVRDFDEEKTLRIANAIKAIYNTEMVKEARASIQTTLNEISIGLSDLSSEVDTLESDMERDGGWISRIFNTDQINDLIASKLPQLRDQLIAVRAAMDAAPEGSDAQMELSKRYAQLTKQYDKFANYVPKVWKDTVKEVDDTFHDGFVAMMKDGKTSWSEFTESLKTKFKTTVADAIYQMFARPLVMNVMATVGGTLGIVGGASAVDGSSGGFGSYLSAANNGYSMFNGGGMGAGLYSDFAMSSFGSTLGLSTGLSSSLGVAGGAGSIMGPSAALAAAEATSAGATGLTALGSSIGAALPYVGLAIAAVSLLSSAFGKGGTPHAGGITFSDGTDSWNPRGWAAIQSEYAAPMDAGNFGESDWTKRYNQTVADSIAPTATTLAQLLNTSSDAFGNGSDYKVGLAFSSDGEDSSRGRYSIVDSSGEEVFDWGSKKFSSDASEGLQQFINATGSGIISVLTQMDLPEWAASLVEQVGADATIDEAQTLVNQLTAIKEAAEKLSPALEMTENDFASIYVKAGDSAMSAYYSLVTSSAEQLSDSYRVVSDAFGDLGVAVPTSIDGFRALITSLDETTKEGQATIASLFGLSEAFGSVQTAIDSLKSGVTNAVFSFYPEDRQIAYQQTTLDDMSTDLGIATPKSIDDILALADSIDYTTEAGLELASALPDLVTAFSNLRTSLTGDLYDNLGDIANLRSGLIDSIFDAELSGLDTQGQVAKLKERETGLWDRLNAGDLTAVESLQETILQRIDLETQATDTQLESAEALLESMQSVADYAESMRNEVLSLQASDLSPLSYADQLVAAQTQWNETLAKAKAGDESALSDLSSVAQSYLQEAQGYYGANADYAGVFSGVTSELSAFGNSGPSDTEIEVQTVLVSRLSEVSTEQVKASQEQTEALRKIDAVLREQQGDTEAQLTQNGEAYSEIIKLLQSVDARLQAVEAVNRQAVLV